MPEPTAHETAKKVNTNQMEVIKMVTDTNKVSLKIRLLYGSVLLVAALFMYTIGYWGLQDTPYAVYGWEYGLIVALSTIYLLGWLPVGKLYLNCHTVKA